MMKPRRDTPRHDGKAETMRYRFTRRRQTDVRVESESTLTSADGSGGFVHQESHESHEHHSQSFEQVEFGVGVPGEEPAPISPDADLALPPADLGLLPRPNRLQLPSGSECDAADDESNAT